MFDFIYFKTIIYVLLNEINKDGSKRRFESIEKSRVAETRPPKATVPPKFEIMKIAKPKNKTIPL